MTWLVAYCVLLYFAFLGMYLCIIRRCTLFLVLARKVFERGPDFH